MDSSTSCGVTPHDIGNYVADLERQRQNCQDPVKESLLDRAIPDFQRIQQQLSRALERKALPPDAMSRAYDTIRWVGSLTRSFVWSDPSGDAFTVVKKEPTPEVKNIQELFNERRAMLEGLLEGRRPKECNEEEAASWQLLQDLLRKRDEFEREITGLELHKGIHPLAAAVIISVLKERSQDFVEALWRLRVAMYEKSDESALMESCELTMASSAMLEADPYRSICGELLQAKNSKTRWQVFAAQHPLCLKVGRDSLFRALARVSGEAGKAQFFGTIQTLCQEVQELHGVLKKWKVPEEIVERIVSSMKGQETIEHIEREARLVVRRMNILENHIHYAWFLSSVKTLITTAVLQRIILEGRQRFCGVRDKILDAFNGLKTASCCHLHNLRSNHMEYLLLQLDILACRAEFGPRHVIAGRKAHPLVVSFEESLRILNEIRARTEYLEKLPHPTSRCMDSYRKRKVFPVLLETVETEWSMLVKIFAYLLRLRLPTSKDFLENLPDLKVLKSDRLKGFLGNPEVLRVLPLRRMLNQLDESQLRQILSCCREKNLLELPEDIEKQTKEQLMALLPSDLNGIRSLLIDASVIKVLSSFGESLTSWLQNQKETLQAIAQLQGRLLQQFVHYSEEIVKSSECIAVYLTEMCDSLLCIEEPQAFDVIVAKAVGCMMGLSDDDINQKLKSLFQTSDTAVQEVACMLSKDQEFREKFCRYRELMQCSGVFSKKHDIARLGWDHWYQMVEKRATDQRGFNPATNPHNSHIWGTDSGLLGTQRLPRYMLFLKGLGDQYKKCPDSASMSDFLEEAYQCFTSFGEGGDRSVASYVENPDGWEKATCLHKVTRR